MYFPSIIVMVIVKAEITKEEYLNISSVSLKYHIAGGPAFFPKMDLPFAFFYLPGLQKPGRNRFSDKSCLVI